MSKPVRSEFFMRPMAVEDIDAIADWLQDLNDLSLFDRTLTIPPGRDAIREAWKPDLIGGKCPTAFWFVVEARDRAPVALGGLQSVNYAHGDAVLPILVSEAARGGGLGLRIACLLLDLAFDRLRLRRITTFFRADNERSERLVGRAGFREEGRMREAWFVDGAHIDCVIVGLLREEWYARRPALRAELDAAIALTFGPPASPRAARIDARAATLKVR